MGVCQCFPEIYVSNEVFGLCVKTENEMNHYAPYIIRIWTCSKVVIKIKYDLMGWKWLWKRVARMWRNPFCGDWVNFLVFALRSNTQKLFVCSIVSIVLVFGWGEFFHLSFHCHHLFMHFAQAKLECFDFHIVCSYLLDIIISKKKSCGFWWNLSIILHLRHRLWTHFHPKIHNKDETLQFCFEKLEIDIIIIKSGFARKVSNIVRPFSKNTMSTFLKVDLTVLHNKFTDP